MSLTDADYTKAIDAIVERRDAMIMGWASNPATYLPSVHAGCLEKIKGDLRELRRLQAGLAEESGKITAKDSELGAIRVPPGGVKPMPDWLMREHQNDEGWEP